MVKDGAFKEASMIIGDGVSKKIKENPFLNEEFSVKANNNLIQKLAKNNLNSYFLYKNLVLGSVNNFNVFTSI